MLVAWRCGEVVTVVERPGWGPTLLLSLISVPQSIAKSAGHYVSYDAAYPMHCAAQLSVGAKQGRYCP